MEQTIREYKETAAALEGRIQELCQASQGRWQEADRAARAARLRQELKEVRAAIHSMSEYLDNIRLREGGERHDGKDPKI